MTIDPLDLELAVAEGRAMLAAFRQERGVDATEEIGLPDALVSLLHAARAAGPDPTAVVADVMYAVGEFCEEVGGGVQPLPVDTRLGCNLRGRLGAIERAAAAGDDRGARRELLALLKFFPRAGR